MKAVRLTSFGGPEVWRFEEIPVPEPGEKQALVRVMAAGVNFIDVYQRTGFYKVPLPHPAGMEAAGVVEKIGPEFDITPGARVAWAMAAGAYAEFAAVPAARVVPIPDHVGVDAAPAVMLQGMTPHYLSERHFPAQAGGTPLVHAGARTA